VAEAVSDLLRRPLLLAETLHEPLRTVGGVSAHIPAAATAAAAAVRHRSPGASPLAARLTGARRLAIGHADLDTLRQIQRRHGGTLNDAALALVCTALRRFLTSRQALPQPGGTVPALVRVSPHVHTGAASPAAVRAARPGTVLIDLPVGEPDPVRRLTLIRLATASGGAPGGRGRIAENAYRLAITQTSAGQRPLYAAGARLREVYPVMPLTEGHAVTIALASYDGVFHFSVNADRAAVPDVAVLGQGISDGAAELLAAARSGQRPARSLA
jgi:hypothetical protein